MSGESKGIMAQILVGVITGILVGILAGSGTAYLMVSRVDKKHDVHVVEVTAALLAIKSTMLADKAEAKATTDRIEQDVKRNGDRDLALQALVTNMGGSLSSLSTSFAVMAKGMESWEATAERHTARPHSTDG